MTLCNRFVRLSRMGVFDRIFVALAAEAGPLSRLTIDATHLKAHRTAASLLKQGAFSRCIGRSKGGLNAKLPAVCDGQGRPVILLVTEGRASDHRGAALMLPKLPPPKGSIADRGYDSARFRAARAQRGNTACIPSTRLRKHLIPHDVMLYRQRHRIETIFARFKDWRRIAARDDRCARTLLAAIILAAIVTFWLGQ
jgi:transposase